MLLAQDRAVRRVVAIADEDYFYRHKMTRLLPVLLRHRPCQATNPLDKIYAFLGLTEKGSQCVPLIVDYEQDLATAYTKFAKQIVYHDLSLDIFSLPALLYPPSQKPGLPTWVPDWSMEPWEMIGEGLSLANTETAGNRVSQPFCAAGLSSFVPVEEPLDHCLTVQGHRLDSISPTVRWTLTPVSGRAPSPDIFPEQSFRPEGYPMYPFGQKYINGEDFVDAVCQTMLVGNIAPSEKISDLTKQYRLWAAQGRTSFSSRPNATPSSMHSMTSTIVLMKKCQKASVEEPNLLFSESLSKRTRAIWDLYQAGSRPVIRYGF